jgi:hypothetical protein
MSTPSYMSPKVSAGEGFQQQKHHGDEHPMGTLPYSSDHEATSATMVVTPEKSDDVSSTTGAIGSYVM